MINDLKHSFRKGSVLTQLIYINLGVFLCVKIFGVFAFLLGINVWDLIHFLALPAETAQLLQKPWTLISYMFLHEGFLHILFNLLWLYFGGQIFLQYLNSKQLLSTYILGGISGAILYIIAFNTLPAFQDELSKSIALGASASVLAIIAAVATYVPNYSVHFTFIGRVKLKHIAIFSILLDVLSIPKGNAGGHIAHIGGAIFGFFYIKQLQAGKDWSRSFSQLLDYLANTFTQRKRPLKTVHKRSQTDDQWQEKKAQSQKEINRILDKIAQSGYESLNALEKETLFKESKK
ncbi:MAG: rhomboid family intramembrane serine protease [Bacteroidetes bacterium]|nr:rhomboid family intramembrane serine protease [Bacteroidota bacterium]